VSGTQDAWRDEVDRLTLPPGDWRGTFTRHVDELDRGTTTTSSSRRFPEDQL
jgi:hypothetical protein